MAKTPSNQSHSFGMPALGKNKPVGREEATPAMAGSSHGNGHRVAAPAGDPVKLGERRPGGSQAIDRIRSGEPIKLGERRPGGHQEVRPRSTAGQGKDVVTD